MLWKNEIKFSINPTELSRKIFVRGFLSNFFPPFENTENLLAKAALSSITEKFQELLKDRVIV